VVERGEKVRVKSEGREKVRESMMKGERKKRVKRKWVRERKGVRKRD
jgi:hypothetical protein